MLSFHLISGCTTEAEHHQFYGHLDIPLDRLASQKPWIVGFYSSCGPVQYTLKAWCSRMATTLLSFLFLWVSYQREVELVMVYIMRVWGLKNIMLLIGTGGGADIVVGF